MSGRRKIVIILLMSIVLVVIMLVIREKTKKEKLNDQRTDRLVQNSSQSTESILKSFSITPRKKTDLPERTSNSSKILPHSSPGNSKNDDTSISTATSAGNPISSGSNSDLGTVTRSTEKPGSINPAPQDSSDSEEVDNDIEGKGGTNHERTGLDDE